MYDDLGQIYYEEYHTGGIEPPLRGTRKLMGCQSGGIEPPLRPSNFPMISLGIKSEV